MSTTTPAIETAALALLAAKAERARALARQVEAIEKEVEDLKNELKNELGIGKHDLGLVKVTVSKGERESFTLTDGEKEMIRRHERNKITQFIAVRIS